MGVALLLNFEGQGAGEQKEPMGCQWKVLQRQLCLLGFCLLNWRVDDRLNRKEGQIELWSASVKVAMAPSWS